VKSIQMHGKQSSQSCSNLLLVRVMNLNIVNAGGGLQLFPSDSRAKCASERARECAHLKSI
jgi:hypothetical protein